MKSLALLLFTINEAIRKGTLLFYAAVATLILLVFALGISSNEANGLITFFGMPIAVQAGKQFDVGQFIIASLHRQSVFWIVVFGVFGAAGLIPSMLEKGTTEIFLSKPLSRTALLLARAAGAAGGIVINILYFSAGIFLVFGLKLGVWQWGLLTAAVALSFTFLCYFSVVTLVGIITRSSGFTVMLALGYTVISWGLEIRQHGLYLLWNNDVYHRVLDALYYLLPQLSAMLTNSSRLVGAVPFANDTSTFSIIPFVWSFGSAALLYAGSVWYFTRQDY